MEALTIRAADLADVPALSALARRTWSDAFGDGVSAEDEAAALEATRSETYFANALCSETILVAEAEGALAGYVQFGAVAIGGVALQPGDRELQRLYVDTPLQGRRVGRQLMAAALQHARLVDATRILLQVWEKNERAVHLYESLGFQRIGTTTFSVGDQAMQDLVMVLAKGDERR